MCDCSCGWYFDVCLCVGGVHKCGCVHVCVGMCVGMCVHVCV